MVGSRVSLAVPVVLFLGVLASGCSKDEEATGPEYPEAREIVYGFRLQNNLGRALPMANVALYLPMARSSSQNLLEFKVGGTLAAEYRHVEDEAGNSSIFYELKNLPADFTRTVRLQTTIGFATTPHEVDVPDLQRYLEVPTGDSSVGETAPPFEFSAEEDTTARLLKIAAVLPPQPADPAASDTACIERVAEFTRLARINRIAVRPVVGFRVLMPEKEQKPNYSLYCWAEYYDQKRWQTLDIKEAAPVQNVTEYVALRNFYSLQDFRQQTLQGLTAEGFGLTIELEMP